METKKVINRLIRDNREIEKLALLMKRFNPFQVLRADSHEIRHSNVISWLLDPCENHHMGDIFLKKIFEIFYYIGEDTGIRISKHKDFEGMAAIRRARFFDVIVEREKSNMDIVIISRKRKCIIVIENKTTTAGGEKQLQRYAEQLKRAHPGFNVTPGLLRLKSLERKKAESSKAFKYIEITYNDIYDEIEQLLELHKNSMNEKVADFLKFYMESLDARLIRRSGRFADLCKYIYEGDKKAFQEIINHKGSIGFKDDVPEGVLDAFQMVLDYGETHEFDEAYKIFIDKNPIFETGRRKSCFWFILEEWEPFLPSIAGLQWRGLSAYPIACWFEFSKKNNKIYFHIEVGPFTSGAPESRLKFLERLKAEGIGVPENPTDFFTRIGNKRKSYEFEEWGDHVALARLMQEICLDRKDEFKLILNAIKGFFVR